MITAIVSPIARPTPRIIPAKIPDFAAGNQARVPNGILKGVRTLTANIVMEMGYAEGLHREALIATGVVLFVFILIINLAFSIIKMRSEKE